jgi:hypothetical protein
MTVVAARAPSATTVVLLSELDSAQIDTLLSAYGARLECVSAEADIPGSYWRDSEAGLIGNTVYVRADTPAHSFLHELCHFICMDKARRAALVTDAGGTDDEECGVCYLQVLLAERFDGFGAAPCLRDMETWGYSFREGSASAWFDGDGVHSRAWLLGHGLVDPAGHPTLRLRA